RDGRGCRIRVGWKPLRVDVEVLGIKQQRSHRTLWRPRVARAAVTQQLVARDFDESTVATARAAAGEDGSGESGLAVRPQNDLAAVAAPPRRCVDGGRGVDAHRGRRRDHEAFELGARVFDEARVWIAAAPVATDQHLAAAFAAGGIDPRARELDVLAGHQDRAALRSLLPARRGQRAGDLDGLAPGARRLAGPGGGVEPDHAIAPADRVGRDHAAGVDDGSDYGARRRGGELDASAVGSNPALVAHQRLERLAGRDVDHLRGDLVADGERD